MNALIFENARPVSSIAFWMRALLHLEQAGGPGMRHVGQQLEALVAQMGDAPGGLVEGMFQVGVGAEGQTHAGVAHCLGILT